MIRHLCALAATAGLLLAQNFTLTSADLQGQLTLNQVFNGFGCSGKNISPQLSWSDAPEGTKSFALTVYDPDAPTGSGWWHWVVFNIPAGVTALPSGASQTVMPKGSVESMTDFGGPGFGGACPPLGDAPHRYVVTIHALDVAGLDLDATASAALVGFMINSHSLGKASLISYYGR